MVGNNILGQEVVVQETADTVLPKLISVTMNYSTGNLVIECDEMLDLSSNLPSFSGKSSQRNCVCNPGIKKEAH